MILYQRFGITLAIACVLSPSWKESDRKRGENRFEVGSDYLIGSRKLTRYVVIGCLLIDSRGIAAARSFLSLSKEV